MRWMSDSLSIQLERSNLKQREYLSKMFEHYLQIYKEECKKHDPIIIAYSFQKEIDRIIKLQMKKDKISKKISCKKGCAHCCYLNVAVNIDEALLIIGSTLERKIYLDWGKIKRQALAKNDEEWSKLTRDEQRCIFLNKKNACSIYEYRPAACRKYFVISDSDNCNTTTKGSVARWAPIQAEIIYSAMANAKLSATLPIQLLAVKEIDDEMHRGIRKSGGYATKEDFETIRQLL